MYEVILQSGFQKRGWACGEENNEREGERERDGMRAKEVSFRERASARVRSFLSFDNTNC